ncbi:hypothetical protein K439DRAFT_1362995 [Ramaria rubella]|nr:hypothetical protein K439DRAFT_1362995 [Ramaria rubella]
MNTFTSGLKITTETLEDGLKTVGKTLGQGSEESKVCNQDNKHAGSGEPKNNQQTEATQMREGKDGPAVGHENRGSFGGTSGVTSSVSSIGSLTNQGLSIGQNVAKSGLDMGANIVTGTASLTGTALGGVIGAAAETTDAVFLPVNAGLTTLAGLDKLGKGFETVNGLSIGAVRKFNELTTKAVNLNMSGMTPTFFDPDADGVVNVQDTIRGLILLGMDEKNAKYAAYALHGVFTYPTSEGWLPVLSTALPIHATNMGRTRWGRNWGTYERIDWIDDVEVDKVGTISLSFQDEKEWRDYWMQGRQGFGALLLIFEWGTTWPFYVPPGIPVHQIPFAENIGQVVRKAIFPTIFANFRNAREAGNIDKSPSMMPKEN